MVVICVRLAVCLLVPLIAGCATSAVDDVFSTKLLEPDSKGKPLPKRSDANGSLLSGNDSSRFSGAIQSGTDSFVSNTSPRFMPRSVLPEKTAIP